jgi:uncharacterized glyoxalase superfamily protein PhnB
VPDDSPPSTVWPALRARDARGLIRFLVDAFGFVETVAWGDQPDGGGDVVVHAQLDWPVEPGTAGCYVVTADPDAVHARAVAAGAEITDPLHDTDYGSRDFAARDPEGNRWSFGTYRGEPRRV